MLNRYLASVKQALPVDKQADIIRELKANILDEVEAFERNNPKQGNSQAINHILEKYGHPTATAQQYAPQTPLVAGEDMPLYKSILVHGAALIFVFSILQTLGAMLTTDSINPLRLIFQTLFNFIDKVSLPIIAVTIVFYYLGQGGILSKWRYKNWSISKLPKLPQAKVSLSDTFTDITSNSFLLLLLWTPLWMSKDGLENLLFALSPSGEHWRIILTIASVASLAFALYRLTQDTWRPWSLMVYIGDHFLFGVIFIWMATNANILIVNNTEVTNSWPFVQQMVDNNFQYFMGMLGAIIIILGFLQIRKGKNYIK